MYQQPTDEEALKQEEEFKAKYPDMYVAYKWADPLVVQYSQFFRRTKTIPVGVGWSRIIQVMLALIEHHVKNLPDEMQGQIHVDYIKEKFGGLRFSFNHETPFMRGVISFAELLSEQTCEDCGEPGVKRAVGGWIKCRCNACYTKAEEDLKRRNAEFKAKAKK